MAAATKKGRPSKAELERRKRLEEAEQKQKSRQQYIALAFFALGLIFCALAFFEGQYVWTTLHNVMFGMFGVLAYVIGPLFLYMAYLFALGKTPPVPKMLKAIFLTLAVSGAIFIFGKQVLTGKFLEDIPILYGMGTEKVGGGVLSVVLGWTLHALFGDLASKFVIVILLLVAVMLITGKTVLDLINGANKSVDKIKEKRQLAREAAELEAQRKAEQEPAPVVTQQEAKFDIDVALDAKSGTSASIDIPLDDVDALQGQTGRPIELPVRKVPKPTSPIDIPLGPAYKPGGDIDVDIPLPPPKRRATGPAADVVGDVFAREDKIRETFTDFGDAPPLEELIDRASAKTRKDPAARKEPELLENYQSEYRFPTLSLLEKPKTASKRDVSAELRANADALVDTLDSFGVRTRVVDISRGPTVTRYELQPEAGVRLSRIVNLADDLALNLAAMGVRIEAPIPGKAAVGIEVPNKQTSMVHLRSVLESDAYRDSPSPLTIAMGIDISGGIQVGDISKMPHLLIAGSTGMGKSVFINSMIVSLVYKSTPEELQLILIDPKMVEFTVYKGLPHLHVPVVTDPAKAAGALDTALAEMLRRYRTFADLGVRNIEEYNAMVERDYGEGYRPDDEDDEAPQKKPRVVVIIDELADLMMTAPREVENAITRIAQMGRAAGIHLVVATQRPSVDVITGTIKNNIPTRVAFRVSSQVDSRTILDAAGAEKLIGNGDMLYQPVGQPKATRIQGCYVSDEEVARVVAYLKKYAVAQYNEQFMREIEENAVKEKGAAASGDGADPMLDEAIAVVVEAGNASTSMLQRRLKLGYARAARIIDEMEQMGIVGPPEGSKPRTVNMTRQQWQEMMLNRDEE